MWIQIISFQKVVGQSCASRVFEAGKQELQQKPRQNEQYSSDKAFVFAKNLDDTRAGSAVYLECIWHWRGRP